MLPDGAMDVLYLLGAPGARVIGTMSRAIVATAIAPVHVVGVRFRPGAGIDLLGVSGDELRDDSVLAKDVWRSSGRALDEALAGASSARSALTLLSAALIERARCAPAPDARVQRAVASLAGAGGRPSIARVARTAGIGERQLERLFIERVGYGPKLYGRVARLWQAVRLMEGAQRGAVGSFADVASAAGYSDQAHLVRDFRALTGVTPGAYVRERRMSEIDNSAPATVATLPE